MTETRHGGGLSPALVEMVSGLSAGCVSTLVVHPLDVVKTRMQIHQSKSAPSATLTTLSVLQSLAQSPRPLGAFYRGLTPNLIGNTSSWASFFFFKSAVEQLVAQARFTTRRYDDSERPLSSSRIDSLTPADFFLSSLTAGALTQVITNPVWVLKTRMVSSDRAAVGAYPNMWAGARRLLAEEGPRGFYRGLGVSILAVSHGAVQFAVYEPAKRVYLASGNRPVQRQSKQHKEQGRSQSSIMMTNEATMVIATVAKLVAGTVTYPLQVLRSRLQNYDAAARFGHGVSEVAAQVWRDEGVRGFYRGLVPGVIRLLPATWVTFLVYENVRYYLPKWVAPG